MNNVTRWRAARSSPWSAVWTATSASALGVVFLAFPPTTDNPAVLPEVNHPDKCRACASTTPEAKAARDAALIRIGAFEDASVLGGLAE
jgi:hypothetical protein